MGFDLLVTNARLPHADAVTDVGVTDGVIQRIELDLTGGERTVDAEGF